MTFCFVLYWCQGDGCHAFAQASDPPAETSQLWWRTKKAICFVFIGKLPTFWKKNELLKLTCNHSFLFASETIHATLSLSRFWRARWKSFTIKKVWTSAMLNCDSLLSFCLWGWAWDKRETKHKIYLPVHKSPNDQHAPGESLYTVKKRWRGGEKGDQNEKKNGEQQRKESRLPWQGKHGNKTQTKSGGTRAVRAVTASLANLAHYAEQVWTETLLCFSRLLFLGWKRMGVRWWEG